MNHKPLKSNAPAHSILNAQAFRYTSSVETDIRKTFARFRRRQAKDEPFSNEGREVHPLLFASVKAAA